MQTSSESKNILVVDDEASIREFLEIMLKREGYQVDAVGSAKSALSALAKKRYAAMVTDISMPEMNGIELLTKVKQAQHDLVVIIMTAHGSAESAVEAMKLGADDYLTKPFQIEEMKIAISGAVKAKALERENRQLRSELGKKFSLENIVGSAPVMQTVFDLIKRVSSTKTNIMILGESGTGKELVAHAIHRSGVNQTAPFVVINCAAIPETLFESELFGHRKGSFTGAIQDKEGLFQLAHGGTLFLDEVGDIPLSVQVKILRAIQQKNFRAVGGTEDVQVDVRIICATNKDLDKAVASGEFREDLFYRLNVIQIRMPALRERKEDIPILAEHFLSKFNLAMGKSIKGISKEAMRMLVSYNFPGNVRELENIIERGLALETSTVILPESLPQKLFMIGGAAATLSIPQAQAQPASATPQALAAAAPVPTPPAAPSSFDLEKGVEEFERSHILQALEKANGVKKRAAQLLGISFRSLRYRIEKYGISDPNPEENE
ncbi:MAG: sigma-54-dependent transcriptional regulator [Bdellovibrionota bacterium]